MPNPSIKLLRARSACGESAGVSSPAALHPTVSPSPEPFLTRVFRLWLDAARHCRHATKKQAGDV
eukprot:3908082-Prymnesium_polylepis.1